MLTDKDHKQHHNVPYSLPVAYALKGSSMTNNQLVYLVDQVQNELNARNIPVLCETYNGQWHKHITKNKEGSRLTKFYRCDNWNHYANLSKDKCLEELHSISVVKKSTQEHIAHQQIEKGSLNKIRIGKELDSSLEVSSVQGRMKYIHSIHPTLHPDLFKKTKVSSTSEFGPNDIILEERNILCNGAGQPGGTKERYKFSTKECKYTQDNKKKKNVGLTETETRLLDVFRMQKEMDGDIENANVDAFAPEEENDNLETYLKSGQCSLLENIMNEL